MQHLISAATLLGYHIWSRQKKNIKIINCITLSGNITTYAEMEREKRCKNRVHTLLVAKIPGLSRPPEEFFQDLVISQQCLNIATNSS